MSPSAIVAAVALTALGLNIYTAIDAQATPADVFAAVGRSRRRWMRLSLVGAFLSLTGVAIAVYYLHTVRPALRKQLAERNLGALVSPRRKFVHYLLPALSLAAAAAIAANSGAH